MSELVSAKVIKVAMRILGSGRGIHFFLFTQSSEKVFLFGPTFSYSTQLESTERHQKRDLEQGLRLFFTFHNG